ncbi:ureidoglycolate lyase [Geminicoccaceae bacterium 1502E]|nr:ureidoglycolate lyase [Geminicoccaceae bacterium 1502E]
MSAGDRSPGSLQPVPLTREAFAPFGAVVEHAGEGRRHHVTEAFERSPEAASPSLWISRLATASRFPVTARILERHPYSAQTFIPLSPLRSLIVVCHPDPRGAPDLSTLQAFLAGPGQGVSYARNVWHHCLTVFDAPAQFAVIMSLTGRGDDDIFLDLEQPVVIEAPQAWRTDP